VKRQLFILYFHFLPLLNFGQSTPQEYINLIIKADSLYEAGDYNGSAFTYSDAFKANGWKGLPLDRYNAACSWALAGYPDSAFYNLDVIASKSRFTAYDELIADEDLVSLHSDKRWQPLVDFIKTKKDKAEANLNKPLAMQLDSIYTEDQKYRLMNDEYLEKYGRESEEMRELWKTIEEKDSVNLIKVKSILDNYGWLGADVVGERGNMSLFLVIQHSDLETQEKYLPMMKEAVKIGKAEASSLALLIDRIEMRNGRPQVYGSQITFENGKPVVYQIIDEANVNKRRAEVGLDPLENYVRKWNIEYTPGGK